MSKRILFLFLFYIVSITNAQTNTQASIDSLVANYIKELQSRKIDTICLYEDYCVGCVDTYDYTSFKKDLCLENFPNYPIYIFWKESGKTYLDKISVCFEYSKIISENAFWDVYFLNEKVIKNEIVKAYEYETFENSKKVTNTLSADHSGHQNFKFIIKGKIITKEFDSFNLTKGGAYSSESNINYDHNMNLKSKLIVDILEKIVLEAEKNNTFKKIKSR
ncbi:hypothetical protein [Flavobacterium mesophilum]|uniref:hypothetical protein n=1 Tax=Flavobacterium mesophilum TaxID=3143495 RepID=UPI0031CFB867